MKHPHAELMAQYAQDAMETDKPWERWRINKNLGWRNMESTDIFHSYYRYERKPTKKPVDLSVLIDSGIDCEFLNEHGTKVSIGKLVAFQDKPKQYMGDTGSITPISAEHCRPRMNHIHAWQGGDCPLPEGFIVKLYLRDGQVEKAGDCFLTSWTHDWPHKGCGMSDIIAFEVVGLADGYCYPWEVECLKSKD